MVRSTAALTQKRQQIRWILPESRSVRPSAAVDDRARLHDNVAVLVTGVMTKGGRRC
jgi:hypothetical protein